VGKRDVKDRSDADLTQEPEMIKAFRDTWELGIHSYLTYLRDRLLLAKELLNETGSVFLQISDENLHHIREILDDIFGQKNFVSQITFQKTGGIESTLLSSTVDYIVWYSKNKEKTKFNRLYKNREAGDTSLDRYDQILNPRGDKYRLSKHEMVHFDSKEMGRRFQLAPLYSDGASNTPQSFNFNGTI
jgi:adenine-specific DNA-methyltransferase